MARYEVIESKTWKRDDGATASIYGAVPWTSSSEEKRWKIVPRGYTVRDNVSGTVGIGKQPWATRAEAQAWVDAQTAREAERKRLFAARPPGPVAPSKKKTRGRQAHATISARDIREFRGFLKNATDRQVQGIYEKEQRAGRDEYAELAIAEAARRGIELIHDDDHSTKRGSRGGGRKSPAQLDREIAEVLAGGFKVGDVVQLRWEPGTGGVIRALKADGSAAISTTHGERAVPTDALVHVRKEHEERVRRSMPSRAHATKALARKPKKPARSHHSTQQARGSYPFDLVPGDVVMRKDIKGRKKYRVSHLGDSGSFVQVYTREVGGGGGIITFDRSQLRLVN